MSSSEKREAKESSEESERKKYKELYETEKALREAAEERARVAEALLNGTFYATIDQVWGQTTKPYSDELLYEALRRSKAPDIYEYTVTEQNALDEDTKNAAANERNSQGS